MFRPANRRRALPRSCAWACRRSPASRWRPVRERPSRRRPRRPAQDPSKPTFRLGANYVRVDVYPTRNGEPVPDLERADFELLEDGVPQTIDQFERVSLQPTTDRDSRRDPNTVAESREQAADPRRRVFVVFLDTGMTTVEGSHAARKPIVDMLDRLIGYDDLFAVMTPDMGASGITFARRTESLDTELAKHWTWGQRDALVRRDPEEAALEICFPDPAPEKYCSGPQRRTRRAAGRRLSRYRGAAHRAAIRGARALGARRSRRRAGRPAGGAQGRDRRLAGLAAARAQARAWSSCRNAIRRRCPARPAWARTAASSSDVGTARSVQGDGHTATSATRRPPSTRSRTTRRAFAQLVERANRFNVSFYPFDTRGLAVFDRSIGARDDRIRNDPGERSEIGRSDRGPLGRDGDRLANRVSSLRTLAEATDGIAVVNTNDLAGGARRIVNDLSTYYLLGYQSTNTKLDGRWRAITVRVKTPGIQVRARKGYRALTEAEVALMRSGEAPAAAPGTPARGQAGGTWLARRRCRASSNRSPASTAPLPWRSRAAWKAGRLAGAHAVLDRVGGRRQRRCGNPSGRVAAPGPRRWPSPWPAPRRGAAEARAQARGRSKRAWMPRFRPRPRSWSACG